MKRTNLKETLSVELSISESIRFRELFSRARKRNSLCSRSHVIRELFQLANYGLFTEKDWTYWRTEIPEHLILRQMELDLANMDISTPLMDIGLREASGAPHRSNGVKRDMAKMKTAAAKNVRGRKKRAVR